MSKRNNMSGAMLRSERVILNNLVILLHNNYTNSVFVAAEKKVDAILEGRCAPVVTHDDGDQTRVTPGSKEAAILCYQLAVMLDHDPRLPHMSQMMKITFYGDYEAVCQLLAGKTQEEVRQLLNTRESLKRRGALHHAVQGAVELCGDDPNTESFRQKVAAVLPVKNDHHKIVLKLISLGADVNMPDFAGVTPLLLCAAADNRSENILKIAQVLLRAGANPNKQDCLGSIPLLEATVSQNLGLMTLLLEHGADPFIANINDVSPFSYSSSHPQALEIFSKFTRDACKEARAAEKEAAGGNLRRCAADGCEAEATKKCRGCFAVWYCSKEYQLGDWEGNHEAVCKVRKVVRN